jgi:hypothetical protein
VVLLGFNAETDAGGEIERTLRQTFGWVGWGHLPLPTSHSHSMIQHGRFLDAFSDVQPDDLICLSDMDVRIQRDVTPEEWGWVEEVTAGGRVCAYWNGGSADTLALEGDRISLNAEWAQKHAPEGLEGTGCWNCGVMFARAGTFRQLQGHYEALCDEFYAMAPHRSRCQFLINFCVWKRMGGFATLPEPVHSHGHFMQDGAYLLPAGSHVRGDFLCWNGIPIAFLHNFPDLRAK